MTVDLPKRPWHKPSATPSARADQFARLIEPVVRALLGAPNESLSSRDELRYGTNGSLKINLAKGVFYDHEKCEGGGTLDLIERETGRRGMARLDWLRQRGLLDEGAKSNGAHARPNGKARGMLGRIVATYDYTDETGTFLSQVVKYDPKDFRQRRRDETGRWKWSVKNVRPVPYRLPDLIAAVKSGQTIFVVEGEKDVDRLRSLGFAATCNAGGATTDARGRGKWRPALNEHFRGADVVIVPDRDPPGETHAQAVARTLSGITTRIRVLELWHDWPEMPEKNDISDWLDHGGGTVEKLQALIEALPDATPAPVSCGSAAAGDIDVEIERLAGLPQLEYEQQRREVAKALGIRAQMLDHLVYQARGQLRRESTDTDTAVRTFTDDELALQFAARHADDLRYVAAWGRWLRWDGMRWAFDDTLTAFDHARKVCREAAVECVDPQAASSIVSAQTVAAVERLAKADRVHAATVAQWDVDLWLLNTPGGIVDLRTGATRPGTPADYMTMITAVAPGGPCPLWHKFLDTVTGKDASLQKFLQVASGYALTGSTREQILLFLYGKGQNGKTVLIRTIGGVLGDYHKTAPMETFLDSINDRHPTELAGLRGARLVTAAETEQGRRWSETKIKTLTGGDEISARFMRQDFFTYVPQFLLMVYGNHKPGLRSVDDAMRRRLKLIPFATKISEAERDDDLPEKLQAEWPGILAWMIEGCLIWQREGLVTPRVVEAATQSYLAEEDAVGRWLDECCTKDPQVWEAVATLFASWSAWAARCGERTGSSKGFSQVLLERGFEPHRTETGRGFNGLKLVATEQPDRPLGTPL